MEWFEDNWMYAGVVAGVFLLATAPISAGAVGLPLLLIYLQLPAYMFHQLEEHHHDRFRQWMNDTLAGGRQVLSTPAVVVVNVAGVWLVDLIALYLARFVALWLGLIAVYLTLVNALVHVVAGVVLRSYNPGLVTAVVLFIPLGVYALIAVSDVSDATAIDHLTAFAPGVLVHLAVGLHVKHRMAARSRG